MKTFENTESIVKFVENNNYYFRGNQFESFSELNNSACNYFNDITEDFDDREEYYNYFGVDLNDCRVELVRVEKYFNEEYNDVTTVEFYKGYIDPGVNQEDYFHGYIVRN